MKRIATRTREARCRRARWIRIAYDDAIGIDADIERLLADVQRTNGCSPQEASIKLVQMLSLDA